MSLKQRLFKIALPVVIILIAAGAMVALIAGRPEPKKEVKKDLGALVRTLTVEKQNSRVIVTGTGTVHAAQEVSIIPQVSGEVVQVAPSMVAGGFFEKDELLFKIDDTDYVLALEQAKAVKSQAELNLVTIESRARVARMEWERIESDNVDTTPNPLVLYGPQLENARAELASAEAAVKQAEINLKRTEIRASFNCRIRSENVDLGQYVRAGSSVAVVAGTDTAEVIVPLPLDELSWLVVPVEDSEKNGSFAKIHMNISGKDYEWQGRVVRSTGEVDTKSRMTEIVIEVKDPYGLLNKGNVSKTLVSGSFVEVSVKGKTLNDVFIIPRVAVRDNSTVWIMGKDNLLRIRKIYIVRYERENVIVKDGLDDGERVVLTTVSGAADGMKLRTETKGNTE